MRDLSHRSYQCAALFVCYFVELFCFVLFFLCPNATPASWMLRRWSTPQGRERRRERGCGGQISSSRLVQKSSVQLPFQMQVNSCRIPFLDLTKKATVFSAEVFGLVPLPWRMAARCAFNTRMHRAFQLPPPPSSPSLSLSLPLPLSIPLTNQIDQINARPKGVILNNPIPQEVSTVRRWMWCVRVRVFNY